MVENYLGLFSKNISRWNMGVFKRNTSKQDTTWKRHLGGMKQLKSHWSITRDKRDEELLSTPVEERLSSV